MSLRILIVEDDKHTRKILETLIHREPTLQSHEPEIVVGLDGKEGLELLDRGPFHLVITDLLMPRMDGFEFCHKLRKHPAGKTVPLVVTSAVYKDPTTIGRLRAEVGAEFFPKPFQVRELMAGILRLLGLQPVSAGTGTTRAVVAAPAQAAPMAAPAAEAPANGTFADHPPPRLLLDLHERRATGMLVLERGKVIKQIAVLQGAPVTVDSNVRTETLGHFLVGCGVLDEKRHQEALQRARETQALFGRVLIDLGWVSEQQLLEYLGAQMRTKIVNVLRWSVGQWRFVPGETPMDRLHIPVEAPPLVFSGLHKTAHVDEIAQTLARAQGRVALTPRAERHREAFARVFGPAGLEAIGGGPRLEDLMAGTDPAPLLVQLDTLLLCDMATVEVAPGQPRPAPRPSEVLPLDVIAAPPPARPHPASSPSLYQELFGQGEPEPPAPVAAAASAQAQARPASAAEAMRNEVLSEYLAIHAKDFYAVLDVGRDASREAIAQAYQRAQQRVALERFADVDLGPDYAHLEMIHQLLQQAFETLSSTAKRQRYDLDLAARHRPAHHPLEGELLAQQATQALAAGDPVEAKAKLEKAVARDPDSADYHAMLGWAEFLARSLGDSHPRAAAAAARPHLEKALALNPDLLDAHEFAGRIAIAEGDDETAVRHLERVLDADASRSEALTALETAHGRRGDYVRLERQYRKLIHRLSDGKDGERLRRLWWKMGELHNHRLGDEAAARIAYETCIRLAPEDLRPREALAQLRMTQQARKPTAEPAAPAIAPSPAPSPAPAPAPSPAPSPLAPAIADPAGAPARSGADGSSEDRRRLREAWRARPDDPAPLVELFQRSLAGEQWDAAYVTASVLACRGAADAEVGEFFRRHRPRFLMRAQQSLSANWLDRVRHSDDDARLGDLFERGFACYRRAFALGDLGVKASDRLAPEALPEAFSRVSAYVSQLVGVPAPPVYRHPDFGDGVHVGSADPPVLLAGRGTLEQTDRATLAFRLGQAFTYLWPGRALAGGLPPPELKQLLLALVTLGAPAVQVEDPSGEIASLRGRLATASSSLAADIAPIVERLLKDRVTLNLSRYMRGLLRTAERVGLLACNDLDLAARIVGETDTPGAVGELLDFALSGEHLAVRDHLGLSIAV